MYNISRDMKTLRKYQKLEIKNTVTKIKNSFDRLIRSGHLDMVEENISEL